MKRLFSRWIYRQSGKIVIAGILLFVIGLYGSAKLYENLRPDFEQLLPESARSVQDMHALEKRVLGTDSIAVLVLTKNPALAESFMKALGESLEKEIPSRVGRVEYNIENTIQFFKKRRALFLSLEDVEALKKYVQKREQYERDIRNPLKLVVDEPEFDFGALEKSYQDKAENVLKYPNGYFANKKRTAFALLAYLPEFKSKIGASYALHDLVDRHIHELRRKNSAFRNLEIHYTGGVQDLVEEYSSLMHDVAFTTGVVIVLVMLACWFYYGSITVLLLLLFSVLTGGLCTFAITYLIEGYINVSSAFLASIVVGNGVNFGIIFLARFVEEMERKKGLVHAVLLAFRRTDKATWVAAASAGISYGALMATDFRGFRQFGMIGFIGMALCWISAYTVLPASLLLLGQVKSLNTKKWRRGGAGFGRSLAAVVTHYPKTILSLSVLATLLSAYSFVHKGRDLLETNMSNLRDRVSERQGSGYYSRYLHDIFGYPHPTAILADSSSEANQIAAALRDLQDNPNSLINVVHSFQDFLPDHMPEKAVILKEIHDKVEKFGWKRLPPNERKKAEELLTPEALQPFSEKELPDFVLSHFRERDGSLGKLVLVEPPHSGIMEEAKYLQSYVRDLRQTVDAIRPGIPVTGQLAVSADLGDSISRAGPRTTALSFFFVVFFVTLLFRKMRHVVPVILSLVGGTIWLLGLGILAGLKINFVNFIAIPITIGISVDYGINIYQRYLQEKGNRVTNALRQSGAAVFLASLSTIIGYGALLFAGNQAITSFGALATFGEIAGQAAALLTLPAFLVLVERSIAKAATTRDPAASK